MLACVVLSARLHQKVSKSVDMLQTCYIQPRPLLVTITKTGMTTPNKSD